jgi:FixJ family two-component response regulator
MNSSGIIGIVDDDPPMLRSLERLLHSVGYNVLPFDSAEALLGALESLESLEADVLVLDLHLPGKDGLALQNELQRLAPQLPVVFLTGRADIHSTVKAMRGGAHNFLTKPVNETELIEAIEAAVLQSSSSRAAWQNLSSLTRREREVLTHLIAGKLSKQIAAQLGTSEQTIKVHRMRIHEKLGVRSIAEVTRIAMRLGIEPAA